MRNISRPWVASTSSVVPISSTRNAMRSGVIDERVDQPGALAETGAMSPYPVVLRVTVV